MWKRLASALSAIAITVFFLRVGYAEAALPATASLPQSAALQARWKLDEASGTRNDSVGSNHLTDNNTVATGVGPFTDVCADFERDNTESLSRADNAALSLTSSFSIFGWINTESNTVTYTLASKFATGGNQRSYLFQLDINNFSGLVLYLSSNGSATDTPSNAFSPTNGVWYHVGVVYDAPAGSARFYVDGSPLAAATTGVTTSVFDGSSTFYLGSWQTGSADLYDGLMQDMMVWNVALSPAEAASAYASYTSRGSPKTIIIVFYSDNNTYA